MVKLWMPYWNEDNVDRCGLPPNVYDKTLTSWLLLKQPMINQQGRSLVALAHFSYWRNGCEAIGVPPTPWLSSAFDRQKHHQARTCVPAVKTTCLITTFCFWLSPPGIQVVLCIWVLATANSCGITRLDQFAVLWNRIRFMDVCQCSAHLGESLEALWWGMNERMLHILSCSLSTREKVLTSIRLPSPPNSPRTAALVGVGIGLPGPTYWCMSIRLPTCAPILSYSGLWKSDQISVVSSLFYGRAQPCQYSQPVKGVSFKSDVIAALCDCTARLINLFCFVKTVAMPINRSLFCTATNCASSWLNCCFKRHLEMFWTREVDVLKSSLDLTAPYLLLFRVVVVDKDSRLDLPSHLHHQTPGRNPSSWHIWQHPLYHVDPILQCFSSSTSVEGRSWQANRDGSWKLLQSRNRILWQI